VQPGGHARPELQRAVRDTRPSTRSSRWRQSQSAALGRTIGIYPEIKHSTFHASLFGAHAIEDKTLTTLHAAYGNTAQAPVFIQSFESATCST
jgi:glycerophosphoryl diester phosphodiesterase